MVVGFLAAAWAMPAPAAAVVLTDPQPVTCTADNDALVRMPCARNFSQLQTLHIAFVKTFAPMNCRPVGVRFNVAGVPLSPGRAYGLIATAIVRAPSKRAALEEMCEPARW